MAWVEKDISTMESLSEHTWGCHHQSLWWPGASTIVFEQLFQEEQA